jgi:fibronectin-binding autotransporter adhesin
MLSQAAQAANDAWSTTPVSGNFSGQNWTTGSTAAGAPTGTAASGDSLYFGASSNTALTNDDNAFTFAGLTFNSGASAFIIGGNGFTLSGAVVNNSSNLQTINDAITLGAAESVNAATAAVTLGGAITGSFALSATGPGVLTLGSTGNAFSGLTLGTTVTDSGNTNVAMTGTVGSTVNLTNSQNVGAIAVGGGANVINVGANAAITTSTIANLSTSDRFTALNINLGTGASVTTNSTNNAAGVIVVGSQYNILTLNGTDFASNSTNAAGGTVVAATYTPSTATTLGNNAQNTNIVTDVSLSGAATTDSIRFADTIGHTITEASGQILAINGSGGTGGSILMSALNGAVTNTITGGSLTGSQNRGLSILNYDTTSGSSLVINSNFNNFLIGNGVTATSQVLVAGGGNVTLGGANLIDGQLLVDGSKLSVGSDSNLGGFNGTVSVTAATNGSTSVTLAATPSTSAGLVVGDVLLGQIISNIVGATVTLASPYTGTSFSTATTVGFAEGGSVDINGGTLVATNSFVLGETNNTGSTTTGLSTTIRNRSIGLGLKGGTIDVTALNTLTIPGIITGSTGSTPTFGALSKIDTGTLILAGSASNGTLNLNNQAGTTVLANTTGTAVGTTTISGGTLLIGANGNANQTSNIFVNGGALDLNGFGGIGTSFATINGTGGIITNSSTTSNSTLYIGNGGAVYSDTLTIASALTDGASKTLSLTVQGGTTSTRNVDFTGASTFTGITTVNSGTLTVDASTNPNASFAGSKTINIGSSSNASGTLHLLTVVGGSGSFSSNVSLLNSGATVTIVNSGANVPVVLDLNGNVQPILSFVVGTTGEPAGYYGSSTFFADNSGNPSITPANAATESLFSGDGGFDAAVPEPTVAGMLGAISGVSLLRRRRRRV